MSIQHLSATGNQGNFYYRPVQCTSLQVGQGLPTTLTSSSAQLYIPRVSGAPTGGTVQMTGCSPLLYNFGDNKLAVCGPDGTWRQVALT